MPDKPRLTLARLKVLAEFLKHPRRALAECQVSAQTGVKTGSVHPTLRKLEALGWLESEWESMSVENKRLTGQVRRRFYRLTKAGWAGARAAQRDRWGRHAGPTLKVGLTGVEPRFFKGGRPQKVIDG